MTGPLTVAFYGNFQPHLPPEHRHSTETQLAADLETMGHAVLRLQEDTTDWPTVTAVARHADLLLWVTTWWIDPDGARRTLKDLAAAGVPTVGFHLDLYFGLAREYKVTGEPFFECAHVFTADGGHDAEFAAAGVNHHWSPPAVHGPDATIGTPEEHQVWPVIFVGSYPYPHPEHAPARRDMLQAVQTRYGRRLRVFRTGTRGRDLSNLVASATIVLGDSALAGRIPRYWSDRIPETLGRGGFLIHPHVEGIEDHYTDGVHLRLYQAGDHHQLLTLVEHYLNHPDEAAAIAACGRAHVLAHHTYIHRLDAMLNEVFK